MCRQFRDDKTNAHVHSAHQMGTCLLNVAKLVFSSRFSVKKKGAKAPHLIVHALQCLSKAGATSERGIVAVRRLFQLFRRDFLPSRDMKLFVQSSGVFNSTLNPVCAAATRVARAAYDSPD